MAGDGWAGEACNRGNLRRRARGRWTHGINRGPGKNTKAPLGATPVANQGLTPATLVNAHYHPCVLGNSDHVEEGRHQAIDVGKLHGTALGFAGRYPVQKCPGG
jgi:hypothetical protein